MDDVTLVIARADDDLVGGVQRLLSCWSQAGLVCPFLWWHSRGDAGHFVRANDEQDAEPMLKAIGTSEYSTVRLVSLVIAGKAAGGDTGVQELATEVEEIIVARLGAGQRLVRVNLIVPASGVQGLPITMLNSRWDVNLVVADEDRPTPLTISQEVRDPDRLVAHTAAALATVAGLWPGMRAGPFDEFHEGGQQEPRVRVVRSFVRLLRCHDLVDGVARQILDLRENRQWLADVVNALPADDPSTILTKVVDQFFAGPGTRLARQPASPPPAKRPRMLTPREAFLELWRFVVALGRRTPADIAGYTRDWMLDRFEQFAQDVVFGNDSTAQVKIGNRTLLAERDNAQRLSPGATEFADALLSWLGSHPSAAALGAEWGSLKGLSFGMADAGKLPDGIDEPKERTRRLVVIDIDLIAPDPAEAPFEFQSSEPPGADPSALPAAGEDGRPVRYQIAACDPAGAAQANSRLAPETPDRERFDSWLDQRKGSLLWRVGERIASDAAAAESALVDALESIARPRDDPGVDRRETSRMYLLLIVIAVMAVAAVGVGAVLWALDVVTLPTAGAVAALSVIGWLLLSLLVFYPYARKQFRRANALLKRFNEDEAARMVAEHEAGELLRLAAAYREYLDWAVIIGSVLHRPGGRLAHRAPEPDLADLDLPDAVGIGAAETDLRQRRRLAAIVGRRHFHQGWLSGLLIDLTDRSMKDLKYEKGETDDDPTPEPEIDRRARARLRDDLMSGLADIFGQRIRKIVAQNVVVQPLEELFSGLRASKESAPHKFLTVIWERPPSAVRESFSWRLWCLGRCPSEDTEYVLKPPAVAAPPQANVSDIAPVVQSDGTVRVLWAARLDISGPGLWSDLRIFEQREPAAAETIQQSLDGVG